MSPLSATETGFLQAIAADPQNETHRLIYADWLEEQGDGRSELVRVQLQLAELGDFADPKLLNPLQQRQEELWVHLKPIREHFNRLGVTNFVFHKGTIEGITIGAEDFIRNSVSIYRDAPGITKLDLLQATEHFAKLRAVPELKSTRSLRVGGRLEEDHVGELRQMLQQVGVEEFELSHFSLDDPFILLRSITSELKKLVIDATPFSLSIPQHSNISLGNVSYLKILGCRMNASTLRSLLDSIDPVKITHFELTRNTLDAITTTAVSNRFKNLKELSCDSKHLVGALENSAVLKSLQLLKLSRNEEPAWKRLFDYPFDKLRFMQLKIPKKVAHQEVSLIFNSALIPQLYHLQLIGGKIPRQGFDQLCERIQQIPGWETGSKRTFQMDVGKRVF